MLLRFLEVLLVVILIVVIIYLIAVMAQTFTKPILKWWTRRQAKKENPK